MKHPQPETELLMTVRVTPNEVIAMNAAVGFYRRYGRPLTPDHHLFCLLLEHYLKRLNTHLPPQHSSLVEPSGGMPWSQR